MTSSQSSRIAIQKGEPMTSEQVILDLLRKHVESGSQQVAFGRQEARELLAAIDSLIEGYKTLWERNTVLAREREELRADAERYKWLRKATLWPGKSRWWVKQDARCSMAGSELDAAIDAARKGDGG